MSESTITHEDLVLLTEWMARTGSSAEEVAEAVRKPWSYGEELAQAKEAQDFADRVVSARVRGQS